MAFNPKFIITNAIAAALTRVERARGFLDAARLSEEWVSRMQERALVLEAHHTTHIEGTRLTLAQSEKLLSGKKVKDADPEDVRELLNYREAFELVAGYLGSGEPVTEGLIREVHRRLVKDVRGNRADPGAYRKVQNYVVNTATGQVVYTPPSPHDVPHLMTELVAWLNKDTGINAVLAAGIAQFQLVHVHPFVDGNGRAARLLSNLCLYKGGYDFKRLFTISEFYDRDRPAYYDAIRSVRANNMDMTSWLEYFADGLAAQMGEVRDKGEKIIKQDVLALKHGLSDRQRKALALALEQGGLTIKDYESLCPEVSRRTLQRELREMVGKNILGQEGETNKRFYRPGKAKS